MQSRIEDSKRIRAVLQATLERMTCGGGGGGRSRARSRLMPTLCTCPCCCLCCRSGTVGRRGGPSSSPRRRRLCSRRRRSRGSLGKLFQELQDCVFGAQVESSASEFASRVDEPEVGSVLEQTTYARCAWSRLTGHAARVDPASSAPNSTPHSSTPSYGTEGQEVEGVRVRHFANPIPLARDSDRYYTTQFVLQKKKKEGGQPAR